MKIPKMPELRANWLVLHLSLFYAESERSNHGTAQLRLRLEVVGNTGADAAVQVAEKLWGESET